MSDTLRQHKTNAHGGICIFESFGQGRQLLTPKLSEEDRVRHLHYLPGAFSTESQRLRMGQMKESAFVSSIQAPLNLNKTKRRVINLANNPEVGFLTQLR